MENENKNRLFDGDEEEKPIIIGENGSAEAQKEPTDGKSPEENEKYGNRTVFIAGEDYDENKPFLKEGYDQKKAVKLDKKKGRKRTGGTKKQRNVLFALAAVIISLAVALIFVIDYVNTTVFTDEADNTKYYIKRKDNPDYNAETEGSQKKVYVLCDKEGYTLDLTPDGYFSTAAGTLVDVDPETGEYEVVAMVDTEGNEQVGSLRRIVVFPHTPREDIQSIEVHNSYGGYTFMRDPSNPSGDFVIKGHTATAFNKELFSSLVVSTGYTLTLSKIKDPIKDAEGRFTEYGLVPETRIDEDGNEYNYEPAFYVLTDKKGNCHKVIVGDMLVTEGGYYIQYVKMDKNSDGTYTETPRDAVYVVNPDIGNTVLQSLNTMVTPLAVYPMSLNDYFDVQHFILSRIDYSKYDETGNEDDVLEEIMVAFSYVDLDDRMDTERQAQPYQSIEGFLEGYILNDMTIDAMLQSLCDINYLRVHEVGAVDKTLEKYGLDRFRYMLSYIFNGVDDETGEKTPVINYIVISDKTPQGTYYVYSFPFDLVVEVDANSFLFLENEAIDWVDSDLLDLNIASCEELKVESPSYNVTFDFDNSKSDMTDGFASDKLVIDVKRDGMASKEFRNSFTITDKKGYTWTIDAEDITATDNKGVEVSIKNLYRRENKYGKVVKVVDGQITDAEGNSVSVTADTVTLRTANGNETIFGRADLYNFRQFYKLLLYGTISGEVTTEATPEELEALRNLDDSQCQLKLTIKTAEGRELVYRFYKLTERKTYLTINGQGNFFVLRTLVDKIISDVQKAVNGEQVFSDSKY